MDEAKFIGETISISSEEIQSIETTFGSGDSIIKGLHQFSPIKQIPAIARRKYNKKLLYEIILDFSELGIKKKKKQDHRRTEKTKDEYQKTS